MIKLHDFFVNLGMKDIVKIKFQEILSMAAKNGNISSLNTKPSHQSFTKHTDNLSKAIHSKADADKFMNELLALSLLANK